MPLQVRIRTDAPFNDIPFIREWLAETEAGFAFNHNIPGNNHYHIYFFNLNRQADSIRKTLNKYLGDKTRYAVSKTAGKEKLTILDWLAWQYGTTSDLFEPVWVKGFTEAQIQEFKEGATNYYNAEAQREDPDNVEIIRHEHFYPRPDRVWERLREKYQTYEGKTLAQIKSSLAAEWLNNGKAIPRSADLHRYSLSLFYLNKYPRNMDIPEDGLIELFQND